MVLPHSTSSNGAASVPLRQQKWQHILRERPRLAESIQAATGWRVEWIPNRCVLMRKLSAFQMQTLRVSAAPANQHFGITSWLDL